MSNTTSKIKIASLNMNGVFDCNRMRLLVTQMWKDGVSAMAVQDTHVDYDRAREYKDTYPDIKILSSCNLDRAAGVMIIIDTNRVEFNRNLEVINDWGPEVNIWHHYPTVFLPPTSDP